MQEIYYTNSDDSARYLLGRYDMKPLIFLGLNPSTANLARFDMTITKVNRFAERMGFDGFLMINLYPLRCTHPAQLPKRRSLKLCKENISSIITCVKQIPDPVIIAAWGNPITIRPYFSSCLKDLYQGLKPLFPKWNHLHNLTKAGHPRHPSRLSYQVQPYPLDIDHYIHTLKEQKMKNLGQ